MLLASYGVHQSPNKRQLVYSLHRLRHRLQPGCCLLFWRKMPGSKRTLSHGIRRYSWLAAFLCRVVRAAAARVPRGCASIAHPGHKTLSVRSHRFPPGLLQLEAVQKGATALALACTASHPPAPDFGAV